MVFSDSRGSVYRPWYCYSNIKTSMGTGYAGNSVLVLEQVTRLMYSKEEQLPGDAKRYGFIAVELWPGLWCRVGFLSLALHVTAGPYLPGTTGRTERLAIRRWAG